MGWVSIIRDLSFFTMSFILIYYIVQCCQHEKEIQRLREREEKLMDVLQEAYQYIQKICKNAKEEKR